MDTPESVRDTGTFDPEPPCLSGVGVMANRKTNKCPFLKEEKIRKWTVVICTLPEEATCPAPTVCEESPHYIEPGSCPS
jgi:hypothetical protein